LIGQFQVLGTAVPFTEDRNGFNTELFTSTDYAQGDLASVGNENPTEHA
jgi:hypothetical protein